MIEYGLRKDAAGGIAGAQKQDVIDFVGHVHDLVGVKLKGEQLVHVSKAAKLAITWLLFIFPIL
jgi:hypothetical protein